MVSSENGKREIKGEKMTKTCKKCDHNENEHQEWHGLKDNWKCCVWDCQCKKFEAVKITTNYDKDNVKYLKTDEKNHSPQMKESRLSSRARRDATEGDFNLSEERSELKKECLKGTSLRVRLDLKDLFYAIAQQDKTFIKKLKEESAKGFCSHTELCERIDKLAGEKLSK